MFQQNKEQQTRIFGGWNPVQVLRFHKADIIGDANRGCWPSLLKHHKNVFIWSETTSGKNSAKEFLSAFEIEMCGIRPLVQTYFTDIHIDTRWPLCVL